MSRRSKRAPSHCTDEPLSRSESRQKLSSLRRVLSSCYGPRGGLKQMHNSVGGSVRTSSTSAVLLSATNFSEPLLRLIASAVATHATRFSDCGLFAGVFCLSLVEKARSAALTGAQASRVYQHLVQQCTEYLRADVCGCKVDVDLGSIHSLMTLAHSVVTSKPACMLTPPEAQHIASLTVRAFLQSVPSDPSPTARFGRTLTVPLEGHPVSSSALFPGLLVDLPNWQSTDLKRLGPGPHKIVLFGTSLSGDLSEMGDGMLEAHTRVNPEAVLLERLLQLGEQVVRDGVGLFVCQKVIHPVLQQYLKENGLVVIERLGLVFMEPVAQMTGALMVASPYSPVPSQAYGQVGGLHMHCCASKKMLQILPSGEATVSTMVVCHRNETMLDELKVTCQTAEHVLRLALKEPYALLGGGCTETLLSAYIRYMNQSKATEAATALNCSPSEFLLAVDAFCSSLQSVALSLEHDGQQCLMDLTHGHRWVISEDPDYQNSPQHFCCCGQVRNRSWLEKTPLNTEYHTFHPAHVEKSDCHPRLLDSFTSKLNALHVAVETASLVLDVAYIIRDIS